MVNLEEFIIKEDVIDRIKDEEVLMQHLEDGKPLQDLFGFTDETTVEFYEAAKNILEQKRFVDAINAFTFLTTINPYISDFWLGLGMAQQNNEDYDPAIFSYSVAFTLDGRKIFPYVIAAQCCIEHKDYDRALEIIDQAAQYAEEHEEDEGNEQLKKDAEAAKQFVLQKQKKG